MAEQYTPDAYNPALPVATNIAGYMDSEFRAIKERLNNDLGIDSAPSESIQEQINNLSSAIATTNQSVAALEQEVTDVKTELTAFYAADSTWKSDMTTRVGLIEQRLSSTETKTTNNTNKITNLQANPVISSGGSGTDFPADAKVGDVHFTY